MKYVIPLIALSLAACQTTTPVVEKANENIISFKYHGFGMTANLAPEAVEQAAIHCQQYGKTAVYQGYTTGISTMEQHTFMCQ
jgi:hypothetical protein